MFTLRMYYRGRLSEIKTDNYETAVLTAQALYDNIMELGSISIWQGANCLWEDGCPIEVGA